ncbi:hypothetical protein DEO72_LG2g2131 [Vigna unguiculata]|uniref:Uncharacterized protein n=1 Tax=Vigna unguiculata TaxID=3917 RepID=A0A4D6L0M2_VIGUN|nr:hypothetical protein DEO72_LG2g2131 [Vigna unguiculata]
MALYTAPLLPSGPPSSCFPSALTNRVIIAKEKTKQAQHEDKRARAQQWPLQVSSGFSLKRQRLA